MDVSRSTTIARDPGTVYDMVSDITRMHEWSPETIESRWIDGYASAVEGARFVGTNRRGFRRWSTTCTVTAAQRGTCFAFSVRFGPVPIAGWRYDFAGDDRHCTVTESWAERRPRLMRVVGTRTMGIRNYAEHNACGIEATLSKLKLAAEA